MPSIFNRIRDPVPRRVGVDRSFTVPEPRRAWLSRSTVWRRDSFPVDDAHRARRAVVGEVDGRFTRYRLIDDRIREILLLGQAIVRDNADRLTSCLVLATEERP